MAHIIEVYGALCSTSAFVINDINADYKDFGEKGDTDPANARDYGCGNMTFETKQPTKDVLAKYEIDEMEYWTIANTLAEKLSFGSCAWCA